MVRITMNQDDDARMKRNRVTKRYREQTIEGYLFHHHIEVIIISYRIEKTLFQYLLKDNWTKILCIKNGRSGEMKLCIEKMDQAMEIYQNQNEKTEPMEH